MISSELSISLLYSFPFSCSLNLQDIVVEIVIIGGLGIKWSSSFSSAPYRLCDFGKAISTLPTLLEQV